MPPKKAPREKAASPKSSRISQTGIRSGEFITAAPGAKQNQGTVLQVRGFYPPSHYWIGQLEPTTLRDEFNQYAFFAGMTPKERQAYLDSVAVNDDDLYMEDVPSLALKFISIGGTFMTTALTPDQITTLQAGNPNDPEGYWPIQTVYEMFPRKPGSKARKHTLIFRPNNWRLQPSKPTVEDFTGLYLNLDTLSVQEGRVTKPPQGYLRVFPLEFPKTFTQLGVLPMAELAIVTSQVRSEPLTWEACLRLAGPDRAVGMQAVRSVIDWFPPALYKSLLQKIIRTRCREVEYAGVKYPAGETLLAAISLLMLNPGSFVPNIQRFVSGLESAGKRVGVSIAEDAWLADNRYLLALYGGALIAQQDREWQPTDQLITWWFAAALTAQAAPHLYAYDWHTRQKTFPNPLDTLGMAYLLLGELRSFESDIEMMGSIADNQGRAREYVAVTEPMAVMPLLHCIDHHTYTQIAHFMPYEPTQSYSELFKLIWQEVVGMNPRHPRYANWTPQTPFRQNVQRAQWCVWVSQTYTPVVQPALQTTVTYNYTLDPSWLAGLVGPMEIRVGTTPITVVLRADDIYQMTAVRRPGREAKEVPELTEEQRSQALARATQMLQEGLPLQVPVMLPELAGAEVVLRDDEYWIRQGETVRPWEEVAHLTVTVPQQAFEPPSVERSLLVTGTGVSVDADAYLERYLEQVSPAVIRRLVTYLSTTQSEIHLYTIGRDGTGVDYAVSPEDTGVNQVLAVLACLYPAALETIPTSYRIKSGALFWWLRDKILARLTAAPRQGVWSRIQVDKRQLWEHQRDSLETMLARHQQGKRGHEIWIPVGLGKTLIVMRYMAALVQDGTMPEYCVYTLPPSAVDSIQRELDSHAIPYQLMDMRRGGKNQTLQPGLVNLVWHDHLRLMDEQLRQVAPRTLFIVDEFHKTLNKTIRTSIALEIARLSADFVAMSGTIIKDTNPEDLIAWLAMVVEFEVTPKNYWVAIGALISKKVQTNVVVERVNIEAPLLNPRAYYAVVPPGLGGTAAHLNFQVAVALSREAMHVEVMRQALTYIQSGEPVFLVARNAAHQEQMAEELERAGVTRLHLITKSTPITYLPGDPRQLQAIITTPSFAEGYSIVGMRVMIHEVIFGNQATRDQLDGRLNRLNQPSPTVRYIEVHAGIFTYIQKRYTDARNLSAALKGFAADVQLDVAQMRALMAT